MITVESSKEEVGNFIVTTLKLKEEIKSLIIKEDISGDILADITEEDLKSIGIKVIQARKIKAFIDQNKDKFGEKKFTEIISIYSDSTEVSEFFKNSLNFEGDLNNLDGKSLLELNNESIKTLGLNLGQRKKLVKYIDYFKTLKVEPPKELILTKESTFEEVCEYLKKKFKFSEKALKALEDLGIEGGESLLILEESDVDGSELTNEEKENLKNCINDLKKSEPIQEIDITLTEESDKAALTKFLKIKLDISEKGINSIIDELGVDDGATFFLLEAKDIDDDKDLNEEEKKRIKDYLNETKPKPETEIKITKESSLEDVKLFLSKKLNFSEKGIKAIEDLGVDSGEALFLLNEEDIDSNEDLSDEEKDNLKNFLNQEKEREKVDEQDENKEEKKEEAKEETNKEEKKEEAKEETNKTKDNNDQNKDKILEGNNIQPKIQPNNNIKKEEKNQKAFAKDNKQVNANQNKINGEVQEKNDMKNVKDIKPQNKANPIYDGGVSDKITLSPLAELKNVPMINDSKYNAFFILSIKESDLNYINIGTYVDKTGFFALKNSFNNLVHYIIFEQEFNNTKGEIIKSFIFQVPMNKNFKKMTIYISIEKMAKEDYSTDIFINDDIQNYFYINNLNNNCTIRDNKIFEYFFNYFFDEKNKNEEIQKTLIKAMINKICQRGNISLKPNIILKFLKYCQKFKLVPKSLDNIDLYAIDDKILIQKLEKEYIILNDDIESFTFKKEENKKKFLYLLVKIYALCDADNLSELIKSKNGAKYSQVILDLLNCKEVKFEDIKFTDKEDFLLLQKNLLSIAKTKDDFNLINKMSNGLIDSLKFISQNCKEIYELLKKNAPYINKENYYYLKLPEPQFEDDINVITDYLKKIFESLKNLNYCDYKIINLEDIFLSLSNIYTNKSIDEFSKLSPFVDFLRTQKIKGNFLKDYYTSIHTKGINLIKKGEFDSEKIIEFITKKDAFYFQDIFNNQDVRDPFIFQYFPITKKDNDNDIYLKNIQLFKDNKIWELYKQPGKLQDKFFSVILDQMENLKDYKVIFDIFPIKYINRNLTYLIDTKVKQHKLTLLDEKEKDYELLFGVFNNIIKINEINNIGLNDIVIELQINYQLTAKYYFNILKDKSMSNTVTNIKNLIMNFFKALNKEGIISAESFITLLTLSDKKCSGYFLNEMNNMIVNENDFYQKENTQNFLLFKLFFEKCGDLIAEGKISDGIYLFDSLDMKDKMKKNFTDLKFRYDIVSNLIIDDSFYNKVFVVFDFEEDKAKVIYDKIKQAIQECSKKIEIFEIILDYLNTFYSNKRKEIINLIKNSLNKLKQSNVDKILNLDEKKFINNADFNLDELKEKSKNIKYKNSLFFMSIYKQIYDNENLEKSEDDIFKESLDDYKNSLISIIRQKDTKEPFFGIKYVKDFMNIVQNNKMEKEIEFISIEFAELDQDDYIKKELLNDLINFSFKEKVTKLLIGIIYFIDSFSKIKEIQTTNFLNELKSTNDIVNRDEVSGEEIKKAIELLNKYEYDIKKETSIMKFYDSLLKNDEAIIFIKKIKESNLEIRNLNEFIDEVDGSQLQTTDIDNLMDVYIFMNKLLENDKIKTDEELLINFKKEYDNDKEIPIKLQGYLNTYGEIIQLFQLYDENPEMTIQKIDNILKDSLVNIFKDKNSDLFIFNVEYEKYENQDNKKEKAVKVTVLPNEIDELRNKILLSSTNTNALQKEGNQLEKKQSKELITTQFINLFDNIKQLMNNLNSLQSTGYPSVVDFSLKIIDSKGFDENDMKKNLEQITTYYDNINKKYKKDLKKGYEEYPLLRLFYGKQLIQLHQKSTNRNIDISHLLNSVTLNKIKEIDVDYPYNYEINSVENINKYLQKLFKVNQLKIDELFANNKVLGETNLLPGLYRKTKLKDFSDLINKILNIYLNLTGNLPTINTLLICNENTNYEQIKSFFYKAILCEQPILFLITNIECLELSLIQKIIKRFKLLYKKQNYKINSYIIFLYEKIDSALARDIERIIPEKNILNDRYLSVSEKKDPSLENIEVYHSKYSGYGKTKEIIHKVKEKGGEYHYLPIGGSFTRDFVINNLENLKINFKNIKKVYLHLDLSDTDNDDLMTEILFELVILRYIISNNKSFYLGYDMNIIIEIPQGFVDYLEKFRLLNLFKKIYIEKLGPLRLEDNINYIKDSPIAIVGETLLLYEKGQIENKNIDLESRISKSAKEYEDIINRYFTVDNQNYYQKMNFIKILSTQFLKLINCVYLPDDSNTVYIESDDERRPLIRKARKIIIKNTIELSKVFTQSPFDNILTSQKKAMKIFGKYDEGKAVQEGIEALADEKGKKIVFSFEQIKPSLVFFNQDGQSISIISNCQRNEQEYKDLKELWNYNGTNEELEDYKTMKHEKYLEQVKKLFSLDNMTIEQLKNLCENLGNYIFVADNFIKMVRILLNIQAKIPVILMGETGVGKTKLLEMLATLYGHGELRMKRLQIHAGTTDQKIVSFLEEVTEEVKKEGKENQITWIFFDEINTCNSLGLITEIMCNHSYLGKKINDNFVFLGACNPYRILTKKMKESGLVYYNMEEKNKLNNLVYTVNPLPHALLNFVFDFASLQKKDETEYISNTIESIISKIRKEGIIDNLDENLKKEIIKEIVDCINICHDFIRDKYDRSSVSMREIRRFGIFFEYFIKYFKNLEDTYKKMKASLNLTLYLCYYLRLNDKGYRKELSNKLSKFYTSKCFLKIPENEMKKITSKMHIEKSKGIALNRALKENLFTCYICIENTIPLIIIGKPGTGKSLSFQILYNTLKGEYSENEMFRDKGKLYRYYYQGSETSTAEGIEQVFEKALNAQIKNKENQKKKENKIITLVFFDEMGLAERSINNPLKVIHYLLEKDRENSVPFLGISNWRLDAAKINRALSLAITDYDEDDLKDTALAIAESLNAELSNKYKDFFETLAKTYNEYILFNQNTITENKDFHGNRDFYNLIKTAMRELIERRDELDQDERKVLSETGILSLNRNFGGLENSSSKIIEIFKEEYGHKFDEDVVMKFSVLDAIKKNILDPNSRYLMIISEGNDGSDIMKYLLESLGKAYIELVGSKYKKDIQSGRYSEEILNKIKYIMEAENILILRDLDMIYASLYDLFNQNFTIMGDKRFARIAFETSRISSEVNKNFHAIVIVSQSKIQNLKLDPPFLNRFEKHIINFEMLLDKRDIKIAKKIYEFISLIASFNNEKKLKIDLERLLISCELHQIEGLIFKIKNNLKEKMKDNEEFFRLDNPEYEETIIKECLNKIVPTFCQDIIASLIYCKFDQKYKSMKDTMIEIYKQNFCNNFDTFFKKMKSKKNIIYTFSKTNEELFNVNQEIGEQNKNLEDKTIDSIKSEKELLFILKGFTNDNNKNILIMRFSEKHLDKMNSVNYIINNFEKENPSIKEKNILFLVHKQRFEKDKEKIKISQDIIPLINSDYCQIFIDNLQGKENSDVFKIMQKKNEELAKEYIDNSNFIENKIFNVLSYIKYQIIFETKEINMNNFTSILAEKIINNEKLKNLMKKNLKVQGKAIKEITKDIFTTGILNVNDVDFFEIINSKLSTYFISYLLNIIYNGLNENILTQILFNEKIDILMQNEYFNNLIMTNFEKTKYRFKAPIKMKINANNAIIYNGLVIPKSKLFLDKLIKYVEENINPNYIKNEDSLRKSIQTQEKIVEKTKNYYNNNERFIENVKIEINKSELLKVIFYQNNDDLKKIIFEEYLRYYTMKYLQKININYTNNIKVFNFLKIITKIKLSENNDYKYDFLNTIDEFSKIVIFTQGYEDDIKILLDTFVEILKFCDNFEEYIIKVLEENVMKYEISERNKHYTKIVNNELFIIIEAILKGVLLYSIDLLNQDKAKFYEFLYSLNSIEANAQKINKKYLLFSKEVYNCINIIKIYQSSGNINHFEKSYEKILNNLFKQSSYLYNDDNVNLYTTIIELNKIFEEIFVEKTEKYINLLFFMFRQQYKSLSNEDIRIKLIENFFQNKLLIKKSKIFLSDTLKQLKPEVFNEKNKDKEPEINYIKNFLNLEENKKLKKYKRLLEIFNKIDSQEFNELLLYFFECQCQIYFEEILKKYNYNYSEKCCENLLLKVSLGYLKEAIKFTYDNKNNKDKNLLKLYSIAYIKTYCYYYVEINYSYYDKCRFDEINKVLFDKDENNKLINNMRNIYIWRLYFKKFENFDKFRVFPFPEKNIPIYKELSDILQKEEEQGQPNYIFLNNFISLKNNDYFQNFNVQFSEFAGSDKNIFNINFEEVNICFDGFYCILVNKIISYLYSNQKDKIKDKMKYIYEISNEKIQFNQEGKILYKYLLDEDLLQNNIIKKISDNPLTQDEFEILLYSFRFIFNIQKNNKSFYNNLLRKNAVQFIKNNYIPGSFQPFNLFISAYHHLVQELPKTKEKGNKEVGYYVCKDCGYYYDVPYCTFPPSDAQPYKDPNGHIVYGHDHILAKPDIRVFFDQKHLDYVRNDEGFYFTYTKCKNWHDSFQSKTLEQFKEQYVDKYLKQKNKGITEGYTIELFEKNSPVRTMHFITFRILNFILYSFIMGSYILDNISEKESKAYLVENLFPHTLFGIVKKNWELLDVALKEIEIENIQTFITGIFDKIIEIMEKYNSMDTVLKLDNFENEINDVIIGIINDKKNIENINEKYKAVNNQLLSCNPNSMKEIIQARFDPSVYDNETYPDIESYSVSNIINFNSFEKYFNLSLENKKKYSLIDMLVNKDLVVTKNVINMKSLLDINNLENILLNIYSFKISREDAKIKKLNDEIIHISELYNEMNSIKLDNTQFTKTYIEPFAKSWDSIKKTSVQYKCRLLRNLDKGEKPLDMTVDKPLCYFLCDDGDIEGGMFLAAAYQNFICWQNNFIKQIISNNELNGILNSYVPKLKQEIFIQDATMDEIININDNVYKYLNELIHTHSMRNIFDKNGKIDYRKYNEIKYDLDSIEEEMGKLILPGLKSFKNDKIRFITYLFEGFRGQNSTILTEYNEKYLQRDLSEEEKLALNDLLENNNNSQFYNDVFASLQILMNEIIKENYDQNHFIYKIIEALPNYIILNEKLKNVFKEKYQYSDPNNKVFTINSLVSIFEYFESLCWNEIKKNVPPDYQLELAEEPKKFIMDYFEKNKNENKLININNFTTALRRLISRYLAGSREESDIKTDSALKLYLTKAEFWPIGFVDNDLFEIQIYDICTDDIFIGNAYNLYNILEGDNFNDEIKKKMNDENGNDEMKEKENKKNNEEKDNEQNMDNQNEIKDEIDSANSGDEEGEDREEY